jgi:glycosyltransferase involved in cell wall biosynthesis
VTRCSIVISNHDYGAFLRDAVDSALGQQEADVDVVVVDDGSTDDSLAVLASYGQAIELVAKANGGQGSAINAGFRVARGDVVIFLDSDDVLEPTAARVAVAALAGGAVKAHWPLRVMDVNGRLTGSLCPDVPLPSGDLRPAVVADGPGVLHFSPTSGNAFCRPFLESVLPLREGAFRHSPDKYLSWMATASGEIVTITEPLSRYRRHGTNYSGRGSTDDLVPRYAARSEDAFPDVARRLGVSPDAIDRWRSNDWWCRLDRARGLIASAVPDGQPFALLDDFTWAARGTVGGREVRQFAADGRPVDAAVLVAEAARLPEAGVRHLVIADPARWWLDFYAPFAAWLDDNAPVLVDESGIQLRRID